MRGLKGVEQIVVDGGSEDNTVNLALSQKVKVIHTSPGKGRQMNAGAKVATGKILLFLHADTKLPLGFDKHVREAMHKQGVVAGAFQLRIDSPSVSLRVVERVANWRSRFLQLPYGDQAIFTWAQQFCDLGGFSDLPIMEDFELVSRLRSRGRIALAPASVLTSARRWERLGTIRTTLINQGILLAFHMGVEPPRLAHWYQQEVGEAKGQRTHKDKENGKKFSSFHNT